ncbi:unnamed protein product [Nezara viridula]|uniref:Uncharacterized protein n=1 Tax=Nezara viridula TaxID=85310 RepID=A0A9P0EGI8_NEZVI|nr:unnamed protein product [Nezara viridula]
MKTVSSKFQSLLKICLDFIKYCNPSKSEEDTYIRKCYRLD